MTFLDKGQNLCVMFSGFEGKNVKISIYFVNSGSL